MDKDGFYDIFIKLASYIYFVFLFLIDVYLNTITILFSVIIFPFQNRYIAYNISLARDICRSDDLNHRPTSRKLETLDN